MCPCAVVERRLSDIDQPDPVCEELRARAAAPADRRLVAPRAVEGGSGSGVMAVSLAVLRAWRGGGIGPALLARV